jgi:hypothetical protein
LFWSKAFFQSSIIFNKVVWHPHPLRKADNKLWKWELKNSSSWVSIDLLIILGTHSSNWQTMFKGVPQGSFLGPILFKSF